MLDSLDFAIHGPVEGVILVGFCTKGCNAVGDQPRRRRVTSQTLFHIINVLVTKGSKKAPHRNSGGGGLLRDAVGGLEWKLFRVTQQIAGDSFASGCEAGELLL
ncbi:hypothetical protein D3C75_1183120 [compost metagenome]